MYFPPVPLLLPSRRQVRQAPVKAGFQGGEEHFAAGRPAGIRVLPHPLGHAREVRAGWQRQEEYSRESALTAIRKVFRKMWPGRPGHEAHGQDARATSRQSL